MWRVALGITMLFVATAASAEPPPAPATPSPKATATAKRSSLLGTACSYTTSIMAERVQAEGETYTYNGALTRQSNLTLVDVAVPFAIGTEQPMHVIANEFIEKIVIDGHEKTKLELQGKVLDVNGNRFFLLERYNDPSE